MQSTKNKCNSLCKWAETQYFKKCTSKNSWKNKQFWNSVEPFVTNKSSLSSNSITTRGKDKLIDNEKELGTIFGNYYINIVEKTSGKPS